MWKVGDEIYCKEENNWSLPSQTLIVVAENHGWLTVKRKGGTGETFPIVNKENTALVSSNPFVRIKRMFCRAFECPYK